MKTMMWSLLVLAVAACGKREAASPMEGMTAEEHAKMLEIALRQAGLPHHVEIVGARHDRQAREHHQPAGFVVDTVDAGDLIEVERPGLRLHDRSPRRRRGACA